MKSSSSRSLDANPGRRSAPYTEDMAAAHTAKRGRDSSRHHARSGLHRPGWLACLLALYMSMLPCSSASALARAGLATATPRAACADCCELAASANPPSACCAMHDEQARLVPRLSDAPAPASSLASSAPAGLNDLAASQPNFAASVRLRPPLSTVLRL
jgi:hypothetical protein